MIYGVVDFQSPWFPGLELFTLHRCSWLGQEQDDVECRDLQSQMCSFELRNKFIVFEGLRLMIVSKKEQDEKKDRDATRPSTTGKS